MTEEERKEGDRERGGRGRGCRGEWAGGRGRKWEEEGDRDRGRGRGEQGWQGETIISKAEISVVLDMTRRSSGMWITYSKVHKTCGTKGWPSQ